MIEEADLRAAQELFGGPSGSGGSKLDSMLPKSVKDFEEYAETLVSRWGGGGGGAGCGSRAAARYAPC
jgi:hypothetical protein